MYCSNCGNKIEEDEKFCGKCGQSVSCNDIDENSINNQVHIKIKFNHLIILIIIVFVAMLGIFFTIKLNNSSLKNTDNYSKYNTLIPKSQPDWIINVDDKKVFNIPYEEFVEKCKTRLGELSDMYVRKVQSGYFVGGKISYPEGWIIIEKNEHNHYGYNTLLFTESLLGRMLYIEEYDGKVESITFLKSTEKLSSTIAQQTIIEILEEYGIYSENNKKIFEDNVNMTTLRFEDAVVYLGYYLSDNKLAAEAYRNSGDFGYIPYEYTKKEFGNYIKLTIK